VHVEIAINQNNFINIPTITYYMEKQKYYQRNPIEH